MTPKKQTNKKPVHLTESRHKTHIKSENNQNK